MLGAKSGVVGGKSHAFNSGEITDGVIGGGLI